MQKAIEKTPLPLHPSVATGLARAGTRFQARFAAAQKKFPAAGGFLWFFWAMSGEDYSTPQRFYADSGFFEDLPKSCAPVLGKMFSGDRTGQDWREGKKQIAALIDRLFLHLQRRLPGLKREDLAELGHTPAPEKKPHKADFYDAARARAEFPACPDALAARLGRCMVYKGGAQQRGLPELIVEAIGKTLEQTAPNGFAFDPRRDISFLEGLLKRGFAPMSRDGAWRREARLLAFLAFPREWAAAEAGPDKHACQAELLARVFSSGQAPAFTPQRRMRRRDFGAAQP